MAENIQKADGIVELSAAQQAAVMAPIDRPLLILAAAGSGKTLVLCHRILHLISQGMSPKEILGITFTRRAGQDLLSRVRNVAAAVIPDMKTCVEDIRIGTFHSFCLSLLRAFPSHAGLAPNFVIFTPKMQIELLEAILKEWYTETDDKKKLNIVFPVEGTSKKFTDVQGIKEPFSEHQRIFKGEAYRVLRKIRYLESCSSTGQLGLNLEGSQKNQIDEELFNYVYSKYQANLRNLNAIDFNSFIRCTIQLLKKCPQALVSVGLQFKHILVDEFQDTDASQLELLQSLCGQHQHLTIVGDDDQQIYSWRGANGFQNLLRFTKLFPDAEVVKLEQNFRSSGAIVAAARCVIAKNKRRMPKAIRTSSPTGTKLTVCECRNESCEALAVVNFISLMRAQGVPPHQIAVIYRLHRVGLEIQHNLRARGIDCEIKGTGSGIGEDGINVLDANRGALYDILAVFRLAMNQDDDWACKSLLQLLCVVPTTSISVCIQHLQRAKGFSLLHALKLVRSHFLGVSICEHLSWHDPTAKTDFEALEGIRKLLSIVSSTMEDLQTLPMRDVIHNLLQQIAPPDFGTEELSEGAKSSVTKGTPCGSKKRYGSYRILFGGIRSLLKEASHFDSEQKKLEVKLGVMPTFRRQDVTRISYKDMKAHQKGRDLTSQPCPSVASYSDSGHKYRKKALEKLGEFLNRVSIKMHDNELGENVLELPSKHKAVTSPDTVTLSTVHQAKGLEWTCVIFVRANEGILPVISDDIISEEKNPRTPCGDMGLPHHTVELLHSNQLCPILTKSTTLSNCKNEASFLTSGGIPQTDGIEEERRLMYVALTRAKTSVLITHLMAGGGQQLIPSRFLADIPSGLIKRTVCYESNCNEEAILSSQLQDETARFSPPLRTSRHKSFCKESNLNNACDPVQSVVRSEQNIRKTGQSRNMHHSVQSRKIATDSPNPRAAGQLDYPLSETKLGSCKKLSRKVPKSKTERDNIHEDSENAKHLSDDSDFETPPKNRRKKSNKFVVCSPSLKNNVSET